MYIMCLSRGMNALAGWASEQDAQPTLAFIPNAGDTYENPYFVKESKDRIELLGIKTQVIDLRKISNGEEFRSALTGCDGVFVAGGNTFKLLHELRRSGALPILKHEVESGFAYFGESAGAVVLYKDIQLAAMIDDPQDVPELTNTEGLALVDFMTLPHIDREKYAPLFDEFYSKFSKDHKIIKIRDDQAVLTRDGSSFEILESDIHELG